MIQIVKADGAAEKAVISAMKARAAQANQAIDAAAAEIMETVREKGFEAVRDYSLRFDKAEPREISQAELQAAYDRCPADLISALERAAANIKDYNEKLLTHTMEWTSPDGGVVGRVVRGLTRVGIYVPGGTAAYPSSVMMNAVPAKVAGVEEIVMVTPPTENLNDAVLAAAKIAGVDRVIAVGGAQAVAALTYGAGFIPRVDKLVGPGNAFVASAKRQAYGKLDIDMVAGPSEILIIADGKANPKFVAADLLSQAEHDKLASAVLLTDSMELAQAVDAEIIRQTGYLDRSEIMECSLRDFGCAIVCDSLADCAALANEVAPEHLEIVTEDPRALLPSIKNAGAVFLGAWSPEPLGDYLAGPDHVLPTSGTARFFSPLSVDSFLKTMSVIQYDEASLGPIKEQIITLANAEHLTAHANSIRVRFE
ncbi:MULTISPECIES: histidinol dehydrogenase [unclassified Flavonifractor]|uniref:histidinol dehydrogenase n=1 Tax=unclassified Flavonifractor TaxID=2629267 RepID=UPI000B394EB6|nr:MULTISPECIES: histidinol dehydrogenase [unclassified Flavonifractor]OUN14035.1 histidinol dehydrogenase [Flavonifractor sp. An91]OUN84409.1 histidinol dehydrogenase [Flavonifractor sp. An52]